MRNPERIDIILSQLNELWHKNPDLRLGQLISNVFLDPELYFIEDEELINGLIKYYDD